MKYSKVCRSLMAALSLLVICDASHGASASLTLSGLVDSEDGNGYGADVWFAPSEHWSMGAGIGHSESDLAGLEFSGRSLHLNTDVTVSSFTFGVAAQGWKDSNQLDSQSLQGQITWMSVSGFSIGAIIDDRTLKVHYQVRAPLNQTRPARVDFDGTGYGADLAWFGQQWNAGVRYVDYSYGPSLTRVRAAINSPNTTGFPRVQALVDSIVTRAAGAPEREVSVTLGRTLRRTSLQGEWLMQRDALTRTDINSVSLRFGYRLNSHAELTTTLGLSEGGASDSVTFGGMALTLRR
jgi:hypothetical protein